jgi:methylenetetrahydrofolate reductase (NADPH)
MSDLQEALRAGKFAITGEIGPPKGVSLERCLDDADRLRGKVVAINVTDLQSAVMRVGSMAVCARLIARGLEPVYQLTCRDRNRLALQSDLLSAWVLGIRNVLCLTGDHPVLGDDCDAKPVYDLDSVQLLKAASGLNLGQDMTGHDLDGKPDFFLGAVVTPNSEPLKPQLIKMKKKIEAGARFFQTQAVYEPAKFEDFMNQAQKLEVPILAGIVVLKSPAMARFMNENVAGINVPDSVIAEMQEIPRGEWKRKAVEVAARTIRQVRPLCQGVHIMPLGWDELVPEIVEQAGLA